MRVLVAKPGLDGHDKGARLVALALRDAGMEVIYTGLHRTVEQIAAAAEQEDVDVIGLSILSGAHLSICRRLMEATRRTVIVGGVIPARDVPALREMGVAAVFPTDTPFDEIVAFLRSRDES